jgi:hypothetical protein
VSGPGHMLPLTVATVAELEGDVRCVAVHTGERQAALTHHGPIISSHAPRTLPIILPRRRPESPRPKHHRHAFGPEHRAQLQQHYACHRTVAVTRTGGVIGMQARGACTRQTARAPSAAGRRWRARAACSCTASATRWSPRCAASTTRTCGWGAPPGCAAFHQLPFASLSELLASPSELLAPPSELLVSPSELTASPSELSASPSELSASPSELSASPSELVASPSEL